MCKKLLDGDEKKGPVLPRTVCHREMEPAEVEGFFGEPARTEFFPDFISKRGRPFRGALIRKETGRHGFEFPPREPRAPKAKSAKKKTAAKPKAAKKPAAKKKTSSTRKTTRKKASDETS